jgi:hypothetical protein
LHGESSEKEENKMKVYQRPIKVLSVIILGALLMQTVGCGSIFYPERRGQTVHGDIDIVVAVADSAWFLAYIIPGLVAWGVDLYTGAIYLPTGMKRFANQPGSKDFKVVNVDPEQLDNRMIEAIVSEHVGQKIDLYEDPVQILKYRGTNEDGFKAFLSKIDETAK